MSRSERKGSFRSPLAAAIAFGVVQAACAVPVEFQFEAELFTLHPFHNIRYETTSGSIDTSPFGHSGAIPQVILDFYTSNQTISGSFAYDTSTPPVNSSATFSRYSAEHLTVSLTHPVTGGFSIQQAPADIVINRGNFSHSIDISTPFNPLLTGGAILLNNENPETVTIDLLQDFNLTNPDLGLVLPNLAEMPIRMTMPDTFVLEIFELLIRDNSKTALPDLSLPASINRADFPDSIVIFQLAPQTPISFHVDEADYISVDDFNTASDWVAQNFFSIHFGIGSNFDVTSLTGGVTETPGTIPTVPFLPALISADGAFLFEEEIDNQITWWFDPIVATGYEYEILSGPLMTSVDVLPVGTQTQFLISAPGYFIDQLLDAGTPFDFTIFAAGGIGFFTITGIDPAWGLDPDDPLAFVTGLTFAGSGPVNLSMTPITQDTGGTDPGPPGGPFGIPEPATAGLLVVGAAVLLRRRRTA